MQCSTPFSGWLICSTKSTDLFGRLHIKSRIMFSFSLSPSPSPSPSLSPFHSKSHPKTPILSTTSRNPIQHPPNPLHFSPLLPSPTLQPYIFPQTRISSQQSRSSHSVYLSIYLPSSSVLNSHHPTLCSTLLYTFCPVPHHRTAAAGTYVNDRQTDLLAVTLPPHPFFFFFFLELMLACFFLLSHKRPYTIFTRILEYSSNF